MSIIAPSSITERLDPLILKVYERFPNKAIRILPKMVINTSGVKYSF